jgi:hypothetical protein
MRRIIIAAIVLGAATATAAPWSFELPAGYTELPGVADSQLAQLREIPNTVSVDAQFYMSPDRNVQLTRMTWLMNMAGATRARVIHADEAAVAGASSVATTHVSDTRHWVGDQLVAESVDLDSSDRVVRRTLYSVDTSDVLHIVMLICTGPADQLGECEHAQQTLQLTLPNQATLEEKTASPRSADEHDLAYQIGRVIGFVGMLALIIWLVRRSR